MEKRVAILLGYQGYGGLAPLARAFRVYGYDKIVAVVDDASLFPGAGIDEFIECSGILDSIALAGALAEKFNRHTPCICIQDRLIFSYLGALKILQEENIEWGFAVPHEGILRARIKAAARARWARPREGAEPIDPTKFGILSLDVGDSRPHLVSLPDWEGQDYYVKPLSGYGSEAVRRLRGSATIRRWAERTRKTLREEVFNTPPFQVEIDGLIYRPFEDVMIEEVLEGPEFTVDGLIKDGQIACVVQHKTELIHEPFEGNGLILCPPEYGNGVLPCSIPAHWLQGAPVLPTDDAIKQFVAEGLSAIGIKDWVFHAEVKLTARGLRFVEINPRHAGGLLSITAGYQLGLDVSEWCVRMHLKIESRLPMPGIFTAEFPIYAQEKGRFEGLTGQDAMQGRRDVLFRSVLGPGALITRLDQENYLAFVAVMGASHVDVRNRATELRRQLQPIFSPI